VPASASAARIGFLATASTSSAQAIWMSIVQEAMIDLVYERASRS